LLAGDFVGFTAITDPFWPRIDRYLWEWLDRASEHAKIVTCVSKWGISREVMKRLATYPSFFLVLGVTGNFSIEKVPLKTHLRTLEMAKEFWVPCLPISHPYISGVSDLSFLPQIKNMGYDYFDVKGLRYCSANMSSWMPDTSKPYYQGFEDSEILPEDGWREMVADAGLKLLSPRAWYLAEAVKRNLSPRLSVEEASRLVDMILNIANVVSSDIDNVRDAAILRRL